MTDHTLEHLIDTAGTANAIREHLRTITTHWATTTDPMHLGDGTGASSGSRLPASTVRLRADVTLTLAFWVHAMIDEWPAVLQHLEHTLVPHPTTDDVAYPSWQRTGRLYVVTETLDCTSIYAMASLLDREADRLADWATFGPTVVEDLRPLASEVRSVAKPPKRDAVAIGDCHRCGEPVKVRLTQRVPQPTTDPDTYPAWTSAPSTTARAAIIRHQCGEAMTLDEWHEKLVGKGQPLTAEDIVKEIHQRLGLRYSPLTVRVWARRGLIENRGYTQAGHALYDLREVLEALVNREATRAEIARCS